VADVWASKSGAALVVIVDPQVDDAYRLGRATNDAVFEPPWTRDRKRIARPESCARRTGQIRQVANAARDQSKQ
jgi:hypothetical protein